MVMSIVHYSRDDFYMIVDHLGIHAPLFDAVGNILQVLIRDCTILADAGRFQDGPT